MRALCTGKHHLGYIYEGRNGWNNYRGLWHLTIPGLKTDLTSVTCINLQGAGSLNVTVLGQAFRIIPCLESTVVLKRPFDDSLWFGIWKRLVMAN